VRHRLFALTLLTLAVTTLPALLAAHTGSPSQCSVEYDEWQEFRECYRDPQACTLPWRASVVEAGGVATVSFQGSRVVEGVRLEPEALAGILGSLGAQVRGPPDGVLAAARSGMVLVEAVPGEYQVYRLGAWPRYTCYPNPYVEALFNVTIVERAPGWKNVTVVVVLVRDGTVVSAREVRVTAASDLEPRLLALSSPTVLDWTIRIPDTVDCSGGGVLDYTGPGTYDPGLLAGDERLLLGLYVIAYTTSLADNDTVVVSVSPLRAVTVHGCGG